MQRILGDVMKPGKAAAGKADMTDLLYLPVAELFHSI
jgi:hypothetical protein